MHIDQDCSSRSNKTPYLQKSKRNNPNSFLKTVNDWFARGKESLLMKNGMISGILCSTLALSLSWRMTLTSDYYFAIFASCNLACFSLAVCGSERKGTAQERRRGDLRKKEGEQAVSPFLTLLALFNSFFARIPVIGTQSLNETRTPGTS